MLKLPDPNFLMTLFNQDIREGRVRLHPWQIDVNLRFAHGGRVGGVNMMNLVANNGSGKSAMVVAPCAVWLGMTSVGARNVITSASGKQLDQQVGRSVRHLCEQVNKIRPKSWEIKYREYTYHHEDGGHPSTIEMFATDEPGKAEGYHPHIPGAEFAFLVDEGKSITDDLFAPIMRCNGKSHWMNVSSPGQPLGFFYNAVTSGRWWTRKVTYKDCPHIKLEEVEAAKEQFGEHSAAFRSAYLAEFTSVNENIVIPYDRLLRVLRTPPPLMDDGRLRCGVDLAGGGDENVISVWKGNKQLEQVSFRAEDTRVTHRLLLDVFRRFGLKGENIFIDDGYIGRAVINYLRNDGYNTRAVNFGSTAFNNIAYGNRGTELWFNFERHLDYLIPCDDRILHKQLASRYYKPSDRTGRIVLESKREARANGHGSPDRGDAAVLAFADLPIGYFAGGHVKKVEGEFDADAHPAAAVIQRLHKARGEDVTLTADEIVAVEELYRSVRAEQKKKSAMADGAAASMLSMLSQKQYSSLHEILDIKARNN